MGSFKQLVVCDFDKILSACQRGVGSCCEYFKEFSIVNFSYIRTKRYHDNRCNIALWSDLCKKMAWLSSRAASLAVVSVSGDAPSLPLLHRLELQVQRKAKM